MPVLIDPALPAGSVRDREQPRLDAGEGVVLRPWRRGDAEAVRAAFDCPDIQLWHRRRMDTAAEALRWISGWAPRWDNETDASWAVVDGREDRPVGQVGLRTLVLFDGSATLSYWVVPQARGTGVAAGAASAVTRWSFDVVGLRRLSLEHSTANVASCRVAATLGFDLEGTLRGALRHADGWHDMHVHARLRTDAVRPR